MDLPQRVPNGPHASMDLEIETKKTFPGESIHGKVKVRTEEELQDCWLKVTLTGREWCQLDPSSPEEKVADEMVEIFPPKVFNAINGTTCQKDFKNIYEYSLDLPSGDLPASFEANGPHSRGYIRYLVTATFESKEKPQLLLFKKLKVKERFQEKDLVSKVDEGTVMGCCYSAKGKLRMSCQLESLNTLSKVDDSLDIKIDVDNRGCPYNISKVRAKLFERINMGARGRNTGYDDTIVEWDAGEVKGSEEKKIATKQKIPYNEKFATMCTSSKGRLLKRNYYLTVTPNYETFTCSVPTVTVRFNVEHVKTHKKKDQKKHDK